MRWASAISRAESLEVALEELGQSIRADLDGARPDLLLAFVSPHHHDHHDVLPRQLQRLLDPGLLLGCSAAGVIGGGEEVEDAPGISLVAAELPGVDLHPFHLDPAQLPSPDAGPEAWWKAVGVPHDPAPGFLLLGDPGHDPGDLLGGLNFAYAQSPVIGGLASDPRGNALFLGDESLRSGMIGVGLTGNVVLESVVAQGCRAIGDCLVVTRCHQNLILELNGERPTEALGKIYEGLDIDGKKLLERALHLGVAASGLLDPEKTQPEFLIRNVIGADPVRGYMAIGALMRQGQTVRFHLRDAQAAGEDLRDRLGRFSADERETAPAAAVLFSCTGRGEYFYGQPNHDSSVFTECVGAMPIGGFFCAGEIGPVGPDTHLLGYTSSFAVFRPREA